MLNSKGITQSKFFLASIIGVLTLGLFFVTILLHAADKIGFLLLLFTLLAAWLTLVASPNIEEKSSLRENHLSEDMKIRLNNIQSLLDIPSSRILIQQHNSFKIRVIPKNKLFMRNSNQFIISQNLFDLLNDKQLIALLKFNFISQQPFSKEFFSLLLLNVVGGTIFMYATIMFSILILNIDKSFISLMFIFMVLLFFGAQFYAKPILTKMTNYLFLARAKRNLNCDVDTYIEAVHLISKHKEMFPKPPFSRNEVTVYDKEKYLSIEKKLQNTDLPSVWSTIIFYIKNFRQLWGLFKV
ncbi:MAG: hypothetical protein ACLGGX_02465 [Bdellovibrionia bacterium]